MSESPPPTTSTASTTIPNGRPRQNQHQHQHHYRGVEGMSRVHLNPRPSRNNLNQHRFQPRQHVRHDRRPRQSVIVSAVPTPTVQHPQPTAEHQQQQQQKQQIRLEHQKERESQPLASKRPSSLPDRSDSSSSDVLQSGSDEEQISSGIGTPPSPLTPPSPSGVFPGALTSPRASVGRNSPLGAPTDSRTSTALKVRKKKKVLADTAVQHYNRRGQNNCPSGRPQGPPIRPHVWLFANHEWKEWPEVVLVVGPSIPPTVGTASLLAEFRKFGNVTRISYEENQKVKVTLTDVRDEFWFTGRININDDSYPIRVFTPRSGFYKISSPVDHQKKYDDRFKFKASGVKFGFLYKPNLMLSMYEIPQHQDVTFLVNLRHKYIEVRFNVVFTKPDQIEGLPGGEQGSLAAKSCDRTESYKFEISFHHLTTLFTDTSDQSDGLRSFVIPAQGPPRYWRQLADWNRTIVESHRGNWSVNDTWMRQTAIEYDMRKRQQQPISMRHKKPVIDIGRWTTYQLTFALKTKAEIQRFECMMDALKDFNVTVDTTPFLVEHCLPEHKPCWDMLDKVAVVDSLYYVGPNPTDCDVSCIAETVRYQLEVCISQNILNEYNVDKQFLNRLSRMQVIDAIKLLEHVADKQKRVFQPMEIYMTPPADIKAGTTRNDLPDYCCVMRRASVTPSGVIFNTPSIDCTNRVLRHFSNLQDHFMRVSFSDEKLFGRINWSDKQTTNELFSRVYQTLIQGVYIGERHYRFLAFGNSQLREHSAYFFHETDGQTCEDIRTWMGEFQDIEIVAKYASRLGQCFSTTKALKIASIDMKEISELKNDNYEFSDGVGKISKALAQTISVQFNLQQESTCFQFRLGGNKGVLAVDPTLTGVNPMIVRTRPSQRKFDSAHAGLEIVRHSARSVAHLNRQLIIVLSALGVPDDVFMRRLNAVHEKADMATQDARTAKEQLIKNIDPNSFTLVLSDIVSSGFFAAREPWVMSLVHLWRAWTVKYLKEKAKIPIEKGAFVLGVVDELGILKGYRTDLPQMDLPEIFLQLTDKAKIVRGPDGKRRHVTDPSDQRTVITGPVVIARNPSLHPGDVRLVMAVDVEELHHHVDVVVFPSTGDRPIPNLLSGGDLDGDDYVIIWDTEFTQNVTNVEPASYRPPKPSNLGRAVKLTDVVFFFVNYIKNDRLGMIANNHLAHADKDGVKCSACLDLAILHSDAVDYPKTGVPALMPRRLQVRLYPHFMEKEKDRTYHSKKILGMLYDQIERVDFKPRYELEFTQKILDMYPDAPYSTLDAAREIKQEYDTALRRILAQTGIKTEFEVISTFVLKHSMGADYKFHEELGRISSNHQERFRNAVKRHIGPEGDLLGFVVVMYRITAEEYFKAKNALEVFGTKRDEQHPFPLISFPWIFYREMCMLMRGNTSVEMIELLELPDDMDIIDPETGDPMPRDKFCEKYQDDFNRTVAETDTEDNDTIRKRIVHTADLISGLKT